MIARPRTSKITFNPGTPIENRALRGLDLDIPDGPVRHRHRLQRRRQVDLPQRAQRRPAVDRGRIDIDGDDVTRRPAAQRADLVARVFQDPMAGTCEALTIEENMALAEARGRAPRPGPGGRPAAGATTVPREAAHPQPRPGEPARRPHGPAVRRPAPGGEPADGVAASPRASCCSTSTPRRSTRGRPSSCWS